MVVSQGHTTSERGKRKREGKKGGAVVVDLEVAVEVVVFVEGGLQGVGEVVLPGVVDEVVVSGEGGDHRTILCNVFHIAAVFLLWR